MVTFDAVAFSVLAAAGASLILSGFASLGIIVLVGGVLGVLSEVTASLR